MKEFTIKFSTVYSSGVCSGEDDMGYSTVYAKDEEDAEEKFFKFHKEYNPIKYPERKSGCVIEGIFE